MYRGTIAEMVPGDHVVIVLITGETKRFSMSDVVSSGPVAAPPATPPIAASAPPAPPPPPSAPADDRVALTLESDRADVAFSVKTGQTNFEGVGWGGRGPVFVGGEASSYSTLCTAPCTAKLPRGSYHVGVSEHAKAVIEPKPQPVTIPGPGTLRVTHTSYAVFRGVGAVIALGSLVGGIYLLVDAENGSQDCSSGYCVKAANSTELAEGSVLLAGGLLIGILMMVTRDPASITFEPATGQQFDGHASPVRSGVAFDGRGVLVRF